MKALTGTQQFKLVTKQDRETGEIGLMFEDTPVIEYPMVANEGGLLAHDLLEHVNGLESIGSIDDELEALGAIWFVRGQHGQLRKDGVGSMYSPEDNIASDVLNMARIYNGGVEFKTEVPEIDRDHIQYETFKYIAIKAYEDTRGEIDSDERNDQRLRFYVCASIAYMQAGYNKAVERFNDESYNAFNLFFNIADTIDSAIKDHGFEHEGQEFVLDVDFDRLNACFEKYFESESIQVQIDFNRGEKRQDFTVYDMDFSDVDSWLDSEELDECNNGENWTVNEIEYAAHEERPSLVLPFDDSRDITIDFQY